MSAAMERAAVPVLEAARKLAAGDKPVLLTIDGRCGSGKSTLAAWLAARLPCHLIHMDDFYLPPARRRPDWTEHPGANMDFARLRAQLLDPLLAGQPAVYQAYACRLGTMRDPHLLPPRPLILLEGSYALHPDLAVPATCRVFTTCTQDCQQKRLQAREGDHYAAFVQRWIPLEEGYFRQYHPETGCDFVLDTTAWTV